MVRRRPQAQIQQLGSRLAGAFPVGGSGWRISSPTGVSWRRKAYGHFRGILARRWQILCLLAGILPPPEAMDDSRMAEFLQAVFAPPFPCVRRSGGYGNCRGPGTERFQADFRRILARRETPPALLRFPFTLHCVGISLGWKPAFLPRRKMGRI